jgi:hypothetical protein
VYGSMVESLGVGVRILSEIVKLVLVGRLMCSAWLLAVRAHELAWVQAVALLLVQGM